MARTVIDRKPPIAPDATAIPALITASDRDAIRLREAIAEHYGILVTLVYCRDLLAFVDKMTKGPDA